MRCLLFACLLMGCAHAFALDRLQVEGYTLPNGLQLLLKPAPNAGMWRSAWWWAWAWMTSCEDKELPHLLEHLLFSGIDGGGEGGLEERMQALGGEWNAYTSNADTTFVIEAPARTSARCSTCCWRSSRAPSDRRQYQRRQAGGRARRRRPLLPLATLARPPGPGPTASINWPSNWGSMRRTRRSRHLTRDQLESLRKTGTPPTT
jgi:hypothetical protein